MSENVTPKEETDEQKVLDKPKEPRPDRVALGERMRKHFLRMETDAEYRKQIEKRLS